MNQPTQVLIGSLLGGTGVGLLILIRVLPRPRAAPTPAAAATPSAVVRTGYRWCPAEHRTVAVFLHPDGTATCADHACGAHIPAPGGDS